MAHTISDWLERLFKIKQQNSSIRTEVIAGITTFLAMAYIIVVNPTILAETGMDHGAVFTATCLVAAMGCLIMGIIANYPIALAPGMGLNAYFTYSVCLGMGVPWQTALAAVFVSGLLILALSLFKIREAVINAIPMSLKYAITGGIGLFLALIALKSSGLIVDHPVTLVTMGDLHQPAALLALFGLFLTAVLHYFQIRGALIISILSVTIISVVAGIQPFHGVFGSIPSLEPTLFKFEFSDLFTTSLIGVIFVFLLVDLFDSTGTLIGVSQRANLLVDGKLPRLKRALLADSTAIMTGASLGTSSTTPYIESTAGVVAGGRTGLTAVVVAILFLASLWLSPLAMTVPSFAVAPALLFIGVFMLQGITAIDWQDLSEAVPAFLTIVMMPLCYSIADGIAFGFISYALIKLFTGQAKSVPYMIWIIALLWIVKFTVID